MIKEIIAAIKGTYNLKNADEWIGSFSYKVYYSGSTGPITSGKMHIGDDYHDSMNFTPHGDGVYFDMIGGASKYLVLANIDRPAVTPMKPRPTRVNR